MDDLEITSCYKNNSGASVILLTLKTQITVFSRSQKICIF